MANMAAGRLTFLYPHLFRTGSRWSEPVAAHVARRSGPCPSTHSRTGPSPLLRARHIAPFTTPSVSLQSAFAKRAGKGIEPPPDAPESADKQAQKPAPKESQPPQQDPPQKAEQAQATPASPDASGPTPSAPEPMPTIHLDPPNTSSGTASPMDSILHMGPPPDAAPPPSVTLTPATRLSDASSEAPREAPYVHHFDSYSLVKQLEAGGYTLRQSILAMKAIRSILASHLDAAQAGLVSKSDVDNESYLFRAACSELSAELKNNRRIADEYLRQQRTLLQHEVDILTQSLNQELVMLTDSVRGMFNDRKMAVREQQKTVESNIQQINYKISVELNSDARSEIEGLRWVLIRRSATGIIIMVLLTFGTLRYATYLKQQRREQAEEAKRKAEEARRSDGRQDHSSAPEAAEILAAN